MAKGQHKINMGINIPNANSQALCVSKFLSEVCTKFNKTSLSVCVICAQLPGKVQYTSTSKCTHAPTHTHVRGVSDDTRTYAHCEIVMCKL